MIEVKDGAARSCRCSAGDVDSVVAAYQEPEIQRWHARTMTPPEAEEWIEATHRSQIRVNDA